MNKGLREKLRSMKTGRYQGRRIKKQNKVVSGCSEDGEGTSESWWLKVGERVE